MIKSFLYKKLKNNSVQCETCSHFCVIKLGDRGKCGLRKNKSGELLITNYGEIMGVAIDPIEKKPLARFMPGTQTLSFGTLGCNFKCLHCQNWFMSQALFNSKWTIKKRETDNLTAKITPEELTRMAFDNNCPSISYTYNEPTVFLEFALETMKLARKNNLKNIWVSNGFMSKKTLELILPYLDAINVDLKSFSEKFYTDVCGARLQPVLDNLIIIKNSKIHLEVTTLIIPTKNDSVDELKQIAQFIYNKLGNNIPWHVTAFYPAYKLNNLPITPKEKILEAWQIGKKIGLKFVYMGNV